MRPIRNREAQTVLTSLYGRPHYPWPMIMFAGCALMVVGTVLLLS
jgi:hypothetical protein